VNKIDLLKLRKVENFTTEVNNIIVSNIRELVDDDIPIIGYYVVGSFCFALKENPNDIDIVIVIPKKYRKIQIGSMDIASGYDIINKCARYEYKLKDYFNIKTQLIPRNIIRGQRWENNYLLEFKFGIKNMPYYDLLTKGLYNKLYNEYLPYHFAWDNKGEGYMIKTRKECGKSR